MAEAGGVSKGSQILYEKGNAPTADYLRGAALAGMDILYVLTGERGPASLPSLMLQSIQNSLAEPSDFTPVPVYAAHLAAGDGSINHSDEIIDHLAFRRDWLRRIGVSPASAVIARAEGESMWPTIHDGDAVLIDRQTTGLPTKPTDATGRRPAPIYAMLDDGAARIKRLVLAAPGTLALLSDNPAFAPEFRPITSVTIIGKVMWWGHTNKE